MADVYNKYRRRIVISEYDDRWPQTFEAERQALALILNDRVIAIEHIGSTAVPGLAAKPTVDIAIAIRSLDDCPALIPLVQSAGYLYVPEFEAALPNRRFFFKGTDEHHTHHIHLAEQYGEMWENPILFRDYLRAHVEARNEYQSLKRRLAERCVNDMDAYVSGKTDFVLRILGLAREERNTL